MPGERTGGPKATLAIEPAQLGELVRESVECGEPRALGSEKMRNVSADDARPTTQIDPAAMRALIGNAVPPIDELAKPKRSAQAMVPLDKPATDVSEIVELGADERKTRQQAPLGQGARVENAAARSSTRMWLVILALVSLVAVVGWLR